MRRLVALSVLSAVVALASPALAQTAQTPPKPAAPNGDAKTTQSTSDTRPATPTTNGDTGLWFVPTGEVLPQKKWSMSLQRWVLSEGQGFADTNNFPATFGVGIAKHAELFGSFDVVRRIDRDARPLFFTSTSTEASTGTGGGILVDNPLDRATYTGNQVGDLRIGAKINLSSQGDNRPVAFALRFFAKLPTASTSNGVGSGKADEEFDAVVSKRTAAVEFSGYGGMLIRGNPSGYSLTNGVRWGVGAGFPQKMSGGFRLTTELFGEHYLNKSITAPPGQVGADGSIVPTATDLKDPVYSLIGITWQAPNGFFIGTAATWNMHMSSRKNASPASCTTCITMNNGLEDRTGFQVRIGFHPGVRRFVPPSPPEPPKPPVVEPPQPPRANRPPTVKATCDPCTVEVGKTSTVSADAQDPDGDALTYQWRAPSGSLTSATSRQTPWTAPMEVGPVVVTVTVNDGHGGTASDSVTIQVVKPVVKEYVFEDVHFDFDKFHLLPDALRVLDEAVAAMQANPNLKLEIEGHTCNIGTAEYNLALGERRANAVRDYLTSRGIGADRLHTVSFGEEQPKYDNSREETRRLNRRAALVVRLSGF